MMVKDEIYNHQLKFVCERCVIRVDLRKEMGKLCHHEKTSIKILHAFKMRK